jgi:pre-rRNA-processing protein TSR1
MLKVLPINSDRVMNMDHDMDEMESGMWKSSDVSSSQMEVVQSRAPVAPGKKRVPKGTSSYQAAWIVEETQDADADEIDEEDENMPAYAPEAVSDEEEEFEDVEVDNRSVRFDALEDDEEERQLEEYNRQRECRDHMEFPDEVDTPQQIPASVRFARYRGLKSFRTSPWDPYENLPEDYGRIFQFQNFRRSKKRVMDSLETEGVDPGTRVTVEILNVPMNILYGLSNTQAFVLFGLLPYEHKLSVVNFVVQRTASYTATVKSKDSVIVMCGFRQYVVQPLYSSYTRGGANNVHKFERFLQHKPTVATIYAPIQFGPAPVLMFKHEPKTSWTAGKFDLY